MADTPEDLFLAHLPQIKKVAAHACRQKGFSREESEEFLSTVTIKFLENGYAVLRKFKGESSLGTYLTIVVRNCLQDYLNHIWGKWRPSSEAERLGPVAIQLDKLLSREGFSLDEACEILRTNYRIAASRQELKELAAKLIRRTPRGPLEGEEPLENQPDPGMTPEERVMALEAGKRKLQVLQLLRDAMQKLPPGDGLLVKMSCDFKISQIARTLKLEQKPLYRRLQKIHDVLRQDLVSQGVRPDEIRGLLCEVEDEDEPVH